MELTAGESTQKSYPKMMHISDNVEKGLVNLITPGVVLNANNHARESWKTKKI